MKWKIFSETFTKATESTLRLTRTGPKFGRKNCKTLFLLNQTPGYNNDFIANRKCCKTDGLCIHGLKSAFTLTNRQAVIVGTLLSGTNGINRKHVLITLHKIERNQLRTRKRHLAVNNHWHIHHSWKICRKASGNKTFYKTSPFSTIKILFNLYAIKLGARGLCIEKEKWQMYHLSSNGESFRLQPSRFQRMASCP